MNNRIKELDILKGFGIFLMIIDHVYRGGGTELTHYIHKYIQSFHMPLFFIASGYLWKERPLADEIRKRFTSLIQPWLVFALAYCCIWIAYGLAKGNFHSVVPNIRAILLFPTDKAHTKFASPLWFLWCMFFTDILYSWLNRITKSKTAHGLIVATLAILGILYSSVFSGPILPLSIGPTMTAIVFFHAGDCCKNLVNRLRAMPVNKSALLLVFLLHALLVHINGCVDMRSTRYMFVPLYFINAIVGVFVWFQISRIVSAFNWTHFSKLFTELSTNSISYLCINSIIIRLARKTCFLIAGFKSPIGGNMLNFFDVFVSMVALSSCCFATFLLIRFFPFALGRKRPGGHSPALNAGNRA